MLILNLFCVGEDDLFNEDKVPSMTTETGDSTNGSGLFNPSKAKESVRGGGRGGRGRFSGCVHIQCMVPCTCMIEYTKICRVIYVFTQFILTWFIFPIMKWFPRAHVHVCIYQPFNGVCIIYGVPE